MDNSYEPSREKKTTEDGDTAQPEHNINGAVQKTCIILYVYMYGEAP